MRDSAVIISSTIPSVKYSCSESPLMFWNGRTATDGLSGNFSSGRLTSVANPPYEAMSSAGEGANEALFSAGIADCMAHGSQSAGQGGLRYRTTVPDGGNDVVFPDDALPVVDQVMQEVENLRLDIHDIAAAAQFPPVGVERVVLEDVNQSVASAARRPNRLARRKSGESQEFYKVISKTSTAPAVMLPGETQSPTQERRKRQRLYAEEADETSSSSTLSAICAPSDDERRAADRGVGTGLR